MKGATVPRWVALILATLAWLVAIPIAHGVVPWAISLVTHRYGWMEERPGTWNLLGIIYVALGAALLVWVLLVGIATAPEKVHLRLTPSVLMVADPMYSLGTLCTWLNWGSGWGGRTFSEA
jgi:hypothetical protein